LNSLKLFYCPNPSFFIKLYGTLLIFSVFSYNLLAFFIIFSSSFYSLLFSYSLNSSLFSLSLIPFGFLSSTSISLIKNYSLSPTFSFVISYFPVSYKCITYSARLAHLVEFKWVWWGSLMYSLYAFVAGIGLELPNLILKVSSN